ncbi:hypothetical protein CLU97_1139 [Chryseobacterium sp. 7]|uniref:hypothetical protein n=1 Tax=Chryseobacterium sp. 7 TaxID=2035214 RepID=UPI000F1CFDA8|nr:hypothetical protein [Chryseobacterium sp. 7]RLJ31702.1 hypothetical protein CLU97_1139 [Chryseobacterium sp. 7]
MKIKYYKQNGKIRALFVFLFIICHTMITAQASVPEIEKKNAEAKGLFNERKLDESLKLSKEVVEESKQIEYSQGVAIGSLRVAVIYTITKDPNNGLQYARMAQQEAYTNEDYELKTKINNVLAASYVQLEMTNEAIKAYKSMASDAKKILQPEKSLLEENMAYHHLASIYDLKKRMQIQHIIIIRRYIML